MNIWLMKLAATTRRTKLPLSIQHPNVAFRGFPKPPWAAVLIQFLLAGVLAVSTSADVRVARLASPKATSNQTGPGNPAAVKWFPGHYMTLAANQPREGWKAIACQRKFAGGQRIYTWRQLEPAKGTYDLSAIEADLAYLHQQDQRLILEVWDNSFDGKMVPVPDYLLGAAYKGGIAHPAGHRSVTRTKRWVPAVMDRYLALVQALGNRFDKDPDFAGFIHTETAMESKGSGFEDYDGAEFDAQMRRLVADSRKAFPGTPVILFGNYYSYKGPEGLEALARFALGNGVGWGGPDLRPGKETWGDKIIRSNAGQMALGLSAQYESYNGKWTVPQLLNSATKDLKLNFVFWGCFDRHRQGGLSFLRDVIPAVNACGDELSTLRPANLPFRCK